MLIQVQATQKNNNSITGGHEADQQLAQIIQESRERYIRIYGSDKGFENWFVKEVTQAKSTAEARYTGQIRAMVLADMEKALQRVHEERQEREFLREAYQELMEIFDEEGLKRIHTVSDNGLHPIDGTVFSKN